MRQQRIRTAVAVVVLVLLALAGCRPPGDGETPVVQATAPPSPLPQGRCGDGVCDQAEQANPNLCPQDCRPTPPPALVPPTPTPQPPTRAPATATPRPAAPTSQPPTPMPPTATSAAQGAKPAGKCGDGTCDEMEQKNPALCPQDCATAQASATVPPTVATPTGTDTPGPQSPPTSAPAGAAWESVVLPSGEVAHRGDPASVSQERAAPGKARQANVALILDASGSMNAALAGTGKTRLAVAKEVMAALIPQVPAEVNGALWIYGHRYPQEPKEKSCQDIERVFALGPADAAAYTQKINAVTAIGYTPIADSIEQAARDLPTGDLNSIILVSDGEETCGGDPCALAEALKASEAAVTIHVVGYTVEEVARQQLECIASVSGGTYHDAEDAAGLLQALEEALSATVAQTILRVEVVDPAGQAVHQNVYLYEDGTDHRVSSFIAWKDNAVPPGTFDLLVDTLPWTLYEDLTIEEGSTTIVRIRLGAIRPVPPDGQETTLDFYDAATDKRLGYYGGTVLVTPGTYYLSINGSVGVPVTVGAGETKEVLLGAIRPLTPERKETTAEFLDAATDKRLGYYGGAVLLMPGTYYLGVNGSWSAATPLSAGEMKEYLLGAIHVSGQFEIWDADGARLGYYGDTLLLVPGTYRVKLADGRVVENVVVEAGKVTEVR